MIIVVSPAKTLDFDTPVKTENYTQPDFLADSRKLVKELRELSPEDIQGLMKVSPKIAEENFYRYLGFKTPFTPENARQAVFAFKGDVYTGLDVASWSLSDLKFAQKHLRILSGLYGLLRPLDLMQAYRLEMGTKLSNACGNNLYEFWGDRLSKALNEALDEQRGSKVVVNLASNEYFKAVDKAALQADIVTPVFRDYKNGTYKIISFFAKKARGQMAAWIIQERLKNPDELKAFDGGGYRFNAEMSQNKELVFTRRSE